MTRLPKIKICGVMELDDLDLKSFTHVISIWDPVWKGRDYHEQQFRRKFADSTNIYFAYFDDLLAPQEDRAAATFEQIQEILAFGATANEQSSILIHCWAGVSRSTAVGYAILCQAAGHGSEKECLSHLLRIRPQAIPNSLIVAHAEIALGRNGTMFSVQEELIPRFLIPCDDDEL